MNAIQLRERVDELIDRTRTARHRDRAYYNAINQAIWLIVKDRVESIRAQQKRYSVQSAQRIRDELYTLYKTATISPTGTDKDILVAPADYFYYLLLYLTVSGKKLWCIPTSYGEIGPLKDNPFMKPTNKKPYFNEISTGFRFHIKTIASASSSELWYIKNPAQVSIGEERDKLTTGATLTNALLYYVYEQSVFAGVTYYAGEIITGTGAALTSGTVIISTKIVNCDLPLNMHDEICMKAAAILSGQVENFPKKNDLNAEIERN